MRLFVRVLIWTLCGRSSLRSNFFLGMFRLHHQPQDSPRKGLLACMSPCRRSPPQFVSLLVMRTPYAPAAGRGQSHVADSGWNDPSLRQNATWARVTVIVINLWVGILHTIMQITAFCRTFRRPSNEAAKIDGANWWQIFTKITMPYHLRAHLYLITFTARNNST